MESKGVGGATMQKRGAIELTQTRAEYDIFKDKVNSEDDDRYLQADQRCSSADGGEEMTIKIDDCQLHSNQHETTERYPNKIQGTIVIGPEGIGNYRG